MTHDIEDSMPISEDGSDDVSNETEEKEEISEVELDYKEDPNEEDQKPKLNEDEIPLEEILSHSGDQDVEFNVKNLTPAANMYTDETILEKIDELRNRLSPVEIKEQLDDPTSQLYVLRKMLDTNTSALQLEKERLSNLSEDTTLNRKYISDELRLVDASPVDRADHKGKVVSGKEAELLILAKESDARRVWLLNSGFDVTFRGPTLSELNTFYNKVYTDTEVYGKEFGTHFFLFNDLIIKQSVLELARQLVTNASLKNWSKGNNLWKSISFQDYNVILWTISTLMFKKGYPFSMTCRSPECKFTESVEIDLKKLRFNNYDRLPEECLKILGKAELRSQKDISDYTNALGFSEKIELHGDWVAITKVPSIWDFVEYGAQFNAALIEYVHIDDTQGVLQYLKYNAYKLFAPWIKEIRAMNSDGSVNFRVSDMKYITKILDTELLEETDFGNKIKEFIRDSTLTYIGIPYEKCPSCGHIPENVYHGILPLEVQYTFFIQAVTKLSQNT